MLISFCFVRIFHLSVNVITSIFLNIPKPVAEFRLTCSYTNCSKILPLDKYYSSLLFYHHLTSHNNYSKRKVKSKKVGLNPKPGLGNYTKMAKKLIFRMGKDKIKI